MLAPFYTGRGDDGRSCLFGSGVRVPKQDPIFELLGTLDELNAWLGLCRAEAKIPGQSEEQTERIAEPLEQAQHVLFTLQAQVAGAAKHVSLEHIETQEKTIEQLGKTLPLPNSFYLPGGCRLSAQLDIARTVARHAERLLWNIADTRIIPGLAPAAAYLNRLSSLLYVLVRYANQSHGIIETPPQYS